MIIEMFGPPGAGKSSLCTQIYTVPERSSTAKFITSSELYYSLDSSKKIKAVAWFFLSNPKKLYFYISMLVQARKKVAFLSRLYRLSLILYVNKMVVHDSSEILLVDQGAIQAVWSLMAHAHIYDKEKISRLISILPIKNHILASIFVDCPLDVFLARLMTREKGGGNKTKFKVLETGYEEIVSALHIFQEIKEVLIKNDISVIELNGSELLDINVVKILEFMRLQQENEFGTR